MPWWLNFLWVMCEMVMLGCFCMVIRAIPSQLVGGGLAVFYLGLMARRWWKFLKLGESNDRERNVEQDHE